MGGRARALKVIGGGTSLGSGICANTQNSSRTDQPTRIWGGVPRDPETRNPEPETPKSLKQMLIP